jgi:hypothetical protein
MIRSTELTLVKRRSTWAITSKTSPTIPNGTPCSTHGQGWVKTQVKTLEPLWTYQLSYGPPWAHCLGGYQDRLLGGPLGLPGLRYTVPEGVEHKDYTGVVLG